MTVTLVYRLHAIAARLSRIEITAGLMQVDELAIKGPLSQRLKFQTDFRLYERSDAG
jgi:hypothetical protein